MRHKVQSMRAAISIGSRRWPPNRRLLALVADDEPLVRQLVCTVLARQGWRTVEASDGVEALGLDIDEQVDLLVTDYEMPTITGLELARAIRQRAPYVPVLVISGLPVSAEISRDLGYRFLPKPFELDELISAVGSLIEQRASRAGVGWERETRANQGAD